MIVPEGDQVDRGARLGNVAVMLVEIKLRCPKVTALMKGKE